MARPSFEQIRAVQHQDIFEIKSSLILQPGPAALTDGLAELQKIIERWASPEPKTPRVGNRGLPCTMLSTIRYRRARLPRGARKGEEIAAQFFHARSDRRKIVSGAGSGHASSVSWRNSGHNILGQAGAAAGARPRAVR